MKLIMRTTGVAVLGLALTGCFDSDSSSRDNTQSPPEVIQSGTEFILAELENTTDDRDPVSINNRELSFDDQQSIDALF